MSFKNGIQNVKCEVCLPVVMEYKSESESSNDCRITIFTYYGILTYSRKQYVLVIYCKYGCGIISNIQ